MNVGKRVFWFLLFFLFIIVLSFSLAFSILLSPKLPYSLDEYTNNTDPNNLWNLVDTYQIIDNETNNTNLFIVQKPDNSTNMFSNYNSIFATFLLLIGRYSVICFF